MSERNYLYCNSRKSNAWGKFADDGIKFIVMKGSRVAETLTKSCISSSREEREKLMADGTITDFVFTRDVEFRGISHACRIVTGGFGDGKNLWRDYEGTPFQYSDIFREDDEDDCDTENADDSEDEVNTEFIGDIKKVNLISSVFGWGEMLPGLETEQRLTVTAEGKVYFSRYRFNLECEEVLSEKKQFSIGADKADAIIKILEKAFSTYKDRWATDVGPWKLTLTLSNGNEDIFSGSMVGLEDPSVEEKIREIIGMSDLALFGGCD